MIEILKKSMLFRGFTDQNITHILTFIGTESKNYSKNEKRKSYKKIQYQIQLLAQTSQLQQREIKY